MEQVWLERGEGGDIAGRGRVDTSRKDIWASAAQSKLASHTGPFLSGTASLTCFALQARGKSNNKP